MTNIFTELKIKHADNPFIWYPLFLFLLVPGVFIWYFSFSYLTVYLIVASTCLILLTTWHIYRLIYNSLQFERIQNQAYLNILHLIDIRSPLPPMTGWTAAPDFILRTFRLMGKRKPQLIVEFGSGVSTITSAYYLEKLNGGKILSIDHEQEYAGYTVENLKEHHLESFATVKFAPLKKTTINNDSFIWYDWQPDKHTDKIDMVIVDGPPVKTQFMARYPAVPVVYPYLADGAYIILDDANRRDESQIVERWLKEYPQLKLVSMDGVKGIAVLQKN